VVADGLTGRGDAVVLLATFLLTVFVDLPTAIGVGVVAGSFLFLHRMAETVEVQGGEAVIEDRADTEDAATTDGMKGDVFLFRISGALFFGATAGSARSSTGSVSIRACSSWIFPPFRSSTARARMRCTASCTSCSVRAREFASAARATASAAP